MKMKQLSATGILALVAVAPASFGDAVTFTGTGSDAEVTTALNTFRNALGTLNANVPGSFGSGRREVNWDGVPDSASAPNTFPPDFFNANAAGRARGVVFSTPGDGFQVSADGDNPTGTPTNFANLNPQYGGLFRPFSPQRLFTVLDRITVIDFFVPGTSIPATVSGFGVVFCDVDLPDSTELFFISDGGELLATVLAPAATTPNGGASFVGMVFNAGERVARVGILSGNTSIDGIHTEGPLGGGGFLDLVVMDDFVYGEPVAVPPRCPGDLNGNDTVDLNDLSALLASFGTCVGEQRFNPAAELSGNACVELADLAILLANFGVTCP